MATQNSNAGVPITIWPESDLQRVRLLELPAELLSLVTAENPPRLQIKSKQVLDSSNAKEAHSVLCTPDTTYQIRQVSTSNSVYLIRPHDIADPSHNNDGVPERGALLLPPQTGVEAVAKCDTTIELLPTSASSAVPYIKAALPTYASTGNYGSTSTGSVTKRELISHIPLSEAECEAGWRELACFESQQEPPGSYIPSAKVKVEVWQSALTVAVADGFDVRSPFPENETPPFAIDLPGDWPHEVVVGVFASVSSPTPGGHLAVDEQKAVRLTGINLLQAKSEGRPIEATAFLKAWRDAVPEAWRDKCEFAVLQGYYSLQDNAKSIKFIDTTAATTAAADASAKEAKSLGAKRKWHEKFRASKKTA
ncbi:Putative sister chromatid cohesion protein Dcc1 [Septoria linicola]|uniref:Sister chromatid cohesion protein Dcc1 n=1 Tax=Septoria linicola TaxID=215465 RepID=A0A9Q9EQB8_9PEZI|nr:Putative sister chromatid cohesion protein Dcc1 [Septoria linicola]